MRYVEKYKYLETISLHHPRFLINQENLRRYFSSEQCKLDFDERDCVFMVSDVDLRRAKGPISNRIVTFVNEVTTGAAINYTFSKEEMVDLLESRKALLTSFGFLKDFDKDLIGSNIKKGIRTLLFHMIKATKEGKDVEFWDYSPKLRTLVVQGVKNLYLYPSDVKELYPYLNAVYTHMMKTWETEYKNREIFEWKDTTKIFAFNEIKDLPAEVGLHIPYVSLLMEWAFINGDLDSAYKGVVQFFEDKGQLSSINKSILYSTYHNFKHEDYRAKDQIFSMLTLAKGFTLEYGYPIPIGFEKNVLTLVATLLFRLRDQTLVTYCVESFLNAYLGIAEDLAGFKASLFATLSYNANLLYEYGLITETEKDNYVAQGRKRYYERDTSDTV